jgi:hypothetical protein
MGYRGIKLDLAPPQKQIATHLSLEEAAALDEYARARGLSASKVLRAALREVGALGRVTEAA